MVKHIVITGASSGIGAALAVAYAQHNKGVRLGLTGRNAERLETIAQQCRDLGADVDTAIMSSLAGFRGFPGAPGYCATKAAVRVYGEGLRGSLCKVGVKVSVICPGFVESPMTAVNDYKMPFLMKAEKAAYIIIKGLHKNKGRIAFPTVTAFFAWLLAAIPDCFSGFLLKGAPFKPQNAFIVRKN